MIGSDRDMLIESITRIGLEFGVGGVRAFCCLNVGKLNSSICHPGPTYVPISCIYINAKNRWRRHPSHREADGAGVLGGVRAVDLHRPGAGVVGIIELVGQLAAGNESELAGRAGNGAAFRGNEGERVTALEITPIDGERLVGARR